MNNQQIKEAALAAGFKLKRQPDGSQDLNPYVYDFARALTADAQLREERDALAARLEAAQIIADADRVDHPMHTMKGGEPFEFVSPGWRTKMGRDLHIALKGSPSAASLARRDARMKAEAMAEACRACLTIELGQRDMAYGHTETDGDGEQMVVGDGINYANKAMGAGHCRERIAELIAEYRKQAEGDQ